MSKGENKRAARIAMQPMSAPMIIESESVHWPIGRYVPVRFSLYRLRNPYGPIPDSCTDIPFRYFVVKAPWEKRGRE